MAGLLVAVDQESVSDGRRDLLDDFNKRGELILAVRAPKSDAETCADGSPAFACYKIEDTKPTPTKRKTPEAPGTSQRDRRSKSSRTATE